MTVYTKLSITKFKWWQNIRCRVLGHKVVGGSDISIEGVTIATFCTRCRTVLNAYSERY